MPWPWGHRSTAVMEAMSSVAASLAGCRRAWLRHPRHSTRTNALRCRQLGLSLSSRDEECTCEPRHRTSQAVEHFAEGNFQELKVDLD